MVAGVASGLAVHLDVDPIWIRLAFVVLTFTGGFGVILYIAGWVLMPEEPYGGIPAPAAVPPVPRAHGQGSDARLILGVLFLFIAAIILAGTFDFRDSGLIWGAALIGIGVLLLVGDSGFTRSPAAPPTTPFDTTSGSGFAPAAGPSTSPPGGHTPPPAGAYAGSSPYTPGTPYGYAASFPSAYGRQAYGAPPWTPAAPQWIPAPPPSGGVRLAPLTLALLLLVVGVAAILDNAGVLHMTVALGFGLAFIVLGAALIVGSRFGRAHWLIVLGICLVPFAAAALLIPEPLTGGVGQVRYAPETVTAVQPAYRLAAGQLTVDLSGVTLGDQSLSVTASDAVGQLVVIVPDGTTIDVTGKVGAGEMNLLGRTNSGVQIATSTVGSTGVAIAGTLDLNLSVGCGQITVESAGGLALQSHAGGGGQAVAAAEMPRRPAGGR
jgi:phage shock protein PspC (stress-responsive transcriptional regulator)